MKTFGLFLCLLFLLQAFSGKAHGNSEFSFALDFFNFSFPSNSTKNLFSLPRFLHPRSFSVALFLSPMPLPPFLSLSLCLSLSLFLSLSSFYSLSPFLPLSLGFIFSSSRSVFCKFLTGLLLTNSCRVGYSYCASPCNNSG